MLAQCVRERVGTPEKHTAVPEGIARIKKLPGHAKVRLFREAAHAQRAILARRPRFNIAVTSVGASRTDAEYDYVFSRGRDLDSSAQSRAALGWIGQDLAVGRQPEPRIR